MAWKNRQEWGTLGDFFDLAGGKQKKPYFQGLGRRLGVTLLLLLGVWGALNWPGPLAGKLTSSLGYYVENPASDWTPAIEAFVQDGIWLDSYDRQVFGDDVTRETAAEPADMALPVSGTLTQPFSPAAPRPGIEIAAEPGAEVRAALDGTVVQVVSDQVLGRLIEINHGRGLSTLYAGLAEILVEPGQEVRRGQIVGKLGGSAQEAAELFFGLYRDQQAVDPLGYLIPASEI